MEKIDKLLVGGTVLTMNEQMEIFQDGAVAIQGDSIVATGTRADVEARYEAAETVDCSNHIIMPGLVNAHTHVPMTLLRGMSDDLRLEIWLMGYIMPTEQHFVNEEFCRLGTLLGAAEMIRCGTTLFNDMYYFEEEIAKAAAEAGLRGICGEFILKFPTPDAGSWEEGLARAETFIQAWKDHPLIVPGVAPHAPYTCTDEILQACAELAGKYDVPLHIHVAETAFEVEQSLENHEMAVVPRLEKVGILNTKCMCAHCVHLDLRELRILAKYGVGISHNPSSNLKLASGLAPVQEMLNKGCHVGIGTDGTASNNNLNMFEELHLASMIGKVKTGDPTSVTARDTLLMATRLGAKSMYLDHLTGSLEPGKKADIIVIDDFALHSVPHFSHDTNAIYSRVVYSAQASDVRHTMVNGVWLMRDRQLLTIDEEKVKSEAQALASRIDAFIRQRANNALNKLVSIGGLEQQESFELQVKAHVDGRELLDKVLEQDIIQVLRHRSYDQYDVYFLFDDDEHARVRYREDNYRDLETGKVVNARTRLTYMSPAKERDYNQTALLSRSRFIAPANYPLRFYREYFNFPRELQIDKKRLRWQILYKGVEFFINFDEVTRPKSEQYYLEIKTRTWSLRDAEYKAEILTDIISNLFHLTQEQIITRDYVDLAHEQGETSS